MCVKVTDDGVVLICVWHDGIDQCEVNQADLKLFHFCILDIHFEPLSPLLWVVLIRYSIYPIISFLIHSFVSSLRYQDQFVEFSWISLMENNKNKKRRLKKSNISTQTTSILKNREYD